MSKEPDSFALKMIEIIESHPNGIQFTNLWQEVSKHFPNKAVSSVKRAIAHRYERDQLLNLIYKPERGLYRHIKYREENTMPEPIVLEENKIEKEPKKTWKKTLGKLKKTLGSNKDEKNNEYSRCN